MVRLGDVYGGGNLRSSDEADGDANKRRLHVRSIDEAARSETLPPS